MFNVLLQTLPIDEDEILYGNRRETMFIGVSAFLTRWAESVGPLIAFLILLYTNYIPGTGIPISAQPSEAILGIKFIFYGLNVIFGLLSVLFIYLFPLSGEKLRILEEQIEVCHQKKRANCQDDTIT